jgi:hypothetical protein
MATTSARALVQAEPSDGELARAAQAGDVASLGALLERYRAPLHAAALRIVGHGSAEDAVQETFVIALRRIGENGTISPALAASPSSAACSSATGSPHRPSRVAVLTDTGHRSLQASSRSTITGPRAHRA